MSIMNKKPLYLINNMLLHIKYMINEDWWFRKRRIINILTRRFKIYSNAKTTKREIIVKKILKKYARAGEIFIDIGAYLGVYSEFMARKGLKVFAFEPNPYIFKLLFNRLRRYECVCLNYAIGDSNGKKELHIFPNMGLSSLERKGGKSLIVPYKRLDDFKLNPNWIKIDVGGHEVSVLRGSILTIIRNKPKLIIEFHGNNNYKALKNFLQKIGYKVIVIDSWLGWGHILAFPKKIPKFTVVMPIRNCSKFLRQSLMSVYLLNPSEVILILDKCTDNSEKIIRYVTEVLGCQAITKIIKIANNDKIDIEASKWKFRVAYLRRMAFNIARYDIILNTDCDIVWDWKVTYYISLIGKNKIGFISFNRYDMPPNLRMFLKRLARKFPFPIVSPMTGQYIFFKPYWLKTEDLNSLKYVRKGEDSHLYRSIRKKYKTVFINNVQNYCLNPTHRDFLTGRSKYKEYKQGLIKVLLHSIFYFSPKIFAGYIYERRKHDIIYKNKL